MNFSGSRIKYGMTQKHAPIAPPAALRGARQAGQLVDLPAGRQGRSLLRRRSQVYPAPNQRYPGLKLIKI